MKTQGSSLILAVFALLGIRLTAAPVMAVGDNAELFITASAAIRADDNIYLKNQGTESDTIGSFAPGLDLVFGKNSQTSGNLYFREEFLKYSDHSDQDTSLANVGFNSNYSNGKSKFSLGATYAETAQNDVSIPGSIVERKLSKVRSSGEFAVSEKTSVGIGALYDKTDYGPTGYTDYTYVTVPVDAYFEISPKLQASVGYRYRDAAVSGTGSDSKDHFLSLGARGEFTPKLTGQLRLGYGKRDFDAGGDESQFGVDSNFTYAYSDKTAYRLTVTNDFGTSATGQSIKNLTFGLNANNKIDEQWAWNAGVNYRVITYPTRTDDYYEGTAGVSYVYNSYLNFAATYIYRNNSSDGLASAEFTNNVFSVGANIRY